MAHIVFTDASHSLLEGGVGDLVLLYFLVCLESLVHALRLALVELIRHLRGLVNMRFQVGWLCQVKYVRVECGHLRADIIKEVGLLHMIPLNADLDLLVNFTSSKVQLKELLLVDDHLDRSHLLFEGIESSLR